MADYYGIQLESGLTDITEVHRYITEINLKRFNNVFTVKILNEESVSLDYEDEQASYNITLYLDSRSGPQRIYTTQLRNSVQTWLEIVLMNQLAMCYDAKTWNDAEMDLQAPDISKWKHFRDYALRLQWVSKAKKDRFFQLPIIVKEIEEGKYYNNRTL